MARGIRTLLACVLISSVAGAASAAPKGQEPARTRGELEALRRVVEGAVGQVARPAGGLSAAHGGRAYWLQGTGIVVMVSPRLLPMARRASLDPQVTRAVDEAVKGLQESLKSAESPEVREEIRRSLQQLSETRIRLVGRKGGALRLRIPPEMDAEMAAMNAHAEEFRREAEAAQREAERALQGHLRSMGVDIPAPPEPPAAPLAPSPAPARMAPTPPNPLLGAALPGPGLLVGDMPPMLLTPLPPTPWEVWFSLEGESDDRSADEVVGAVRDAVGRALASHPGPWSALGSDETISVAVDFLSRRGQDGPRTLVLRFKAADLAARAAGKLDEGELRRRVLSTEY